MDILNFGFILISILGIGASVTGERLRELGLLDLEELKLRGVFSVHVITSGAQRWGRSCWGETALEMWKKEG